MQLGGRDVTHLNNYCSSRGAFESTTCRGAGPRRHGSPYSSIYLWLLSHHVLGGADTAPLVPFMQPACLLTACHFLRDVSVCMCGVRACVRVCMCFPGHLSLEAVTAMLGISKAQHCTLCSSHVAGACVRQGRDLAPCPGRSTHGLTFVFHSSIRRFNDSGSLRFLKAGSSFTVTSGHGRSRLSA